MFKRLDELHTTLEQFREELNKMSNYGPKKGGQYTVADNIKRKANNTGDQTGFGQNVNTKSYSSKPGQLSAKAQASQEQRKTKKLSGPVKVYSEEEKAALAAQMGMKASVKKQEEVTTPHGQSDSHELPGKAPLPFQVEEKKKLKDGKKTIELLDFNKSGQWSIKTK
jgi:hypothetical protein